MYQDYLDVLNEALTQAVEDLKKFKPDVHKDDYIADAMSKVWQFGNPGE